MGKIVRGAKVTGDAYFVSVPEAGYSVPPPPPAADFDARFASGHDPLGFNDEEDDLFAQPLIEPVPIVPAVDVERVRADARALIDAAESDAESMLRDAAERAKQLVERANARIAALESEARERGHREGVAAGQASARAEIADSIAAIYDLVESVRRERSVVVESAEPELVKLAMAVAERIVYDQVDIDPTVVLQSVRHALTRLVGREVVTLRVSPADLETIRQHRDEIAGSHDVEHLRIVEDQRVDRGGVVIETDAGTIDAKISTQLREARRALQGDAVGAVSQAS